jgi:hypothetical protein
LRGCGSRTRGITTTAPTPDEPDGKQQHAEHGAQSWVSGNAIADVHVFFIVRAHPEITESYWTRAAGVRMDGDSRQQLKTLPAGSA